MITSRWTKIYENEIWTQGELRLEWIGKWIIELKTKWRQFEHNMKTKWRQTDGAGFIRTQASPEKL